MTKRPERRDDTLERVLGSMAISIALGLIERRDPATGELIEDRFQPLPVRPQDRQVYKQS
jgi:hypothetical protein